MPGIWDQIASEHLRTSTVGLEVGITRSMDKKVTKKDWNWIMNQHFGQDWRIVNVIMT